MTSSPHPTEHQQPHLTVTATVNTRAVSINLHVHQGETLALVGPNGSGKTTTLEVIAGLLAPDTGHITLNGRTLVDNTTWTPAHQRGIVLATQHTHLFPHLTVLDNVAFGPRAHGHPRHSAHDTARHWLTEVNAAHLAHRRAHQLSGGEAQRVNIARTLAADPHILLLDEPTASLDAHAAPDIRELLTEILTNRTTILVSHNTADIDALADRVLTLHHMN